MPIQAAARHTLQSLVYGWKLSNHRVRDLISKVCECHLPAGLSATCSTPQPFLSTYTGSLLSLVKSYRSESHMQGVSVSGMNYTARDVLLYTSRAPVFHILHGSLKQGNDVLRSFGHLIIVPIISPWKFKRCGAGRPLCYFAWI